MLSCKLLKFTYLVVDNEIFLDYVETIMNRYKCNEGQIDEIRAKLERVFTFFIIGKELTMLSPNDRIQLKLIRTE